MKASETLINKIIEFEGMKLEAYRCPAGVWTIGAGHTKGVKPGQKVSKARAIYLLKEDLAPCENLINKYKVINTQGKFDACVDFVFNLGEGKFRSSTLLKYILQGATTTAIQNQFRRWNKAGGKELSGLTKRREWEAQRWAQLRQYAQ